jgi:hypothetical protein
MLPGMLLNLCQIAKGVLSADFTRVTAFFCGLFRRCSCFNPRARTGRDRVLLS